MKKKRYKNPAAGLDWSKGKFPFAKNQQDAFLMGFAASTAITLYLKSQMTKGGKIRLGKHKKKKAAR